jgi:hypothetical protein
MADPWDKAAKLAQDADHERAARHRAKYRAKRFAMRATALSRQPAKLVPRAVPVAIPEETRGVAEICQSRAAQAPGFLW